MADTILPSRRRALLKLSGEALMGSSHFGIEQAECYRIASEVARAIDAGAQVGVVVGGGNIFRGVDSGGAGMDRAQADYMGMIGTMINALAFADALRHAGVDARVLSALRMESVAETFTRSKALFHLEAGRAVVFAAGTGNPFFTADAAAALRGAEIGAGILLRADKADGIRIRPGDEPAAKLSFDQAIDGELGPMDATALSLCRERNLPCRIFPISHPGAIVAILGGSSLGTAIG